MIRLTDTQIQLLRQAARLGATAASVVFVALAISRGPPVAPEGPGIERAIQYIFVVVGILSTGLAWRWSLPGGLLLVLTGLVLGIAAALRFSQLTALLAALLYVIPGVLFLWHWSAKRPRWLQAGFAATLLVVMVAAGVQAYSVHERAFGPAHPQSELKSKPSDRVEWVWSGGVTTDSVRVNARIADDASQARLLVSPNEDLTVTAASQNAPVEESTGNVVSLAVDGLEAGRQYYYAIEVDGQVDTLRRGSFRTFPAAAETFSILVSSCARTGSSGLVFEAMEAEEALLYLITGDFHYENITGDNKGAFRRAYEGQLIQPAQAALYQTTPIAYVWDDHDFGGSNSNGTSAASEAARLTYREQVPHYDLPSGQGDEPIFQAFTAGSVRFVMTDTRSMRDLEDMPDGSASLLGVLQREWLKRELLESSRTHDAVVWVNSVPWIAPASGGRDDWGGYATERAEIANFIADNGITNLLMLSGDAHMLAIDDGTNSDYSDNGGAGFPVLQAAALDRPGSTKGGPYSEGAFPGAGQYGLVTFHPQANGLRVDLVGKNWLREEIVSLEVTLTKPVS